MIASATTRSPRAQNEWSPPELRQPAEGYRFTTDSWLLAAFAAGFKPTDWCDLGTGCGVIAYALSDYLPKTRGVAIERQADLADFARLNLSGRDVLVIQGDLRFFP